MFKASLDYKRPYVKTKNKVLPRLGLVWFGNGQLPASTFPPTLDKQGLTWLYRLVCSKMLRKSFSCVTVVAFVYYKVFLFQQLPPIAKTAAVEVGRRILSRGFRFFMGC